MKSWSLRRAFVVGVALVLVVNAVALAGAWYNRSGTPDATLRLSERELLLPWGWGPYAENSGMALQMRWRVAMTPPAPVPVGAPRRDTLAWLDAPAMQALGFTVPATTDADARRRYARQLSRDVFLVLELDGPAYRAAVQRASEELLRVERLLAAAPADERLRQDVADARLQLQREQTRSSRLFIVDAGLSLAALRARYPDRGHYAILPGQVGPLVDDYDNAVRYRGYITGVKAGAVHVPLAFRPVFEGALRAGSDEAPARFVADIHVGRRLEPWLVAASMPSGQP